MEAADPQSHATKAFRQLLADMVLWLALVLLFLAFRLTLFLIFRGELSPQPSGQAFLRCFETGLRSDATAATWALLPSLTLTLVGFVYSLGIWQQRIRRLTSVVALTLCAIIFVTDIGYFAEYDNQFDHWIFGLIYDDRAAILATIWKSYHLLLLVLIGAAAAGIVTWLLSKLLREAESADVPSFLGTKTARVVTILLV